MKVYLDSGVFIDYLVAPGHVGAALRATDRRGRTPERLREDAEACLVAILERHAGMTSSLMGYEVEEALYGALRDSGISHPRAIPAARDVVIQALVTAQLFRIRLLDLTPAIVMAQCANVELQHRGVRAADALHVMTALAEGADLLVTTDSRLIKLDNVFAGAGGQRLRFVDTDKALALLA